MRNINRTTASLFSGAGFGDMGFESAGFEHMLLCEIDPKRTAFTSLNFPKADVLTTNVAENVDLITSKIHSNLKKRDADGLFLLYATPPCQGMSKNGIGTILKAMSEDKRSKVDKRNQLYLPVIEVVKNTLPKWIFFENVCRLFNFKDVDDEGSVRFITEILESEFYALGYVGKFEKVQMADYGLPQTRLRTVGIFRKKEGTEFSNDISFLPPKVIDNPKDRVTLRDVIFNNEHLDANCPNGRLSLSNSLHRVPKWRDELNFWMKNTPEGASAFDNNICISCQNKNERVDLECSKCGSILPKPTIVRNSERKMIKGFVSAYKRMYWDKPASTITTRSAYACSDHKVHPNENRVLSIFEIATLQGIDIENVNWNDHTGKQFSDTLLRELIGESVPPFFTRLIGEYIEEIESNISSINNVAV
ncbi:MAG: DNA cytosine methyltransferase [Robiginitomaculum sp.]|nr:MAG: DNA cytosine methyltransferase [Robiginitomaculum sp.]